MTQAPKNLQTIESHVLDLQRLHPSASGDFTSLLNDISFAAKVVSREVTKAGLVEDILGATGEERPGRGRPEARRLRQQRLPEVPGHAAGQVCIMGSEELADPVFADTSQGTGNYIVVFDPLDGSSNIDANVSVGTIFGIWKRKSSPGPGRRWTTSCSPARSWWPPATSSTDPAPCSSTPPATASTASPSTRASANSCSATRTS